MTHSDEADLPSNPLRTIAHCDIDAAYARESLFTRPSGCVSLSDTPFRSPLEFEQVRLGLPDDLPLICAQWQSIIAVNYPARKFGIKRCAACSVYVLRN